MTDHIEERMKDVHISAYELDKICHQIKALRDCYITLHNSIISRQSSLETANLKNIEKLTDKLEDQIDEIKRIEQGKIELILPDRFNVLMGTLEFLAKKLHKIDERLEKIENERHKEFTLSVKVEEKKEDEYVNNDPIHELLLALPNPYKTVILHRFINTKKKSQKEIAALMGYKSQSRIGQLETKALRMLRGKEFIDFSLQLPKGTLRTAIFGAQE